MKTNQFLVDLFGLDPKVGTISSNAIRFIDQADCGLYCDFVRHFLSKEKTKTSKSANSAQ
jgi:hypothetical protein